MTQTRMPVLFAGHGSPMSAIENNADTKSWQALGQQLPKPRAILSISAHWYTDGSRIQTSPDPKQIYDMYGFPQELYQIHYEPKSSVSTADRVLELLGNATVNNSWGIDHGIWAVLSNMFPEADVPVVMVSTDTTASAAEQFAAGQKLAQLRSEGALILASGNIVHNLGMVDWENDHGYPWADAFDQTMQDAVKAHDFATPIQYEKLPDAGKAVPTSEHYNPFLAALGAANKQDKVTIFNDYRELGSMSMTSYLF